MLAGALMLPVNPTPVVALELALPEGAVAALDDEADAGVGEEEEGLAASAAAVELRRR